ncbi:hypothetical protein ACQKD6_24355 [Bacillus cereus]|uniref:hypothetical protein n=1 Tax=Bacillus cereus TaxID=1396 RepID=UPI003D004782
MKKLAFLAFVIIMFLNLSGCTLNSSDKGVSSKHVAFEGMEVEKLIIKDLNNSSEKTIDKPNEMKLLMDSMRGSDKDSLNLTPDITQKADISLRLFFEDGKDKEFLVWLDKNDGKIILGENQQPNNKDTSEPYPTVKGYSIKSADAKKFQDLLNFKE